MAAQAHAHTDVHTHTHTLTHTHACAVSQPLQSCWVCGHLGPLLRSPQGRARPVGAAGAICRMGSGSIRQPIPIAELVLNP